jgi:adenine-specific DNA-methyltransferase
MIQSLPMHTPDGTAANIAAIAAAFPHCITESRNAAGEVVKAVDFDLLRQELSASIVEGPQERYQLNWPGKRDALLAANAPIAKTLRPDRAGSVAFDTTQNLYIEGDNLDALKLLQETYLGAVKMIYIDPPYNTGHDFVYNDDFAEDSGEYLRRSQQVSVAGERMVANLDSNGRFHSDWLSMMYPRLKLARNLLKDDGVIFISIDDNEQANLKRLCDEVFGEDNFVASFIWQHRKSSQNDVDVSLSHNYTVCFAKNRTIFKLLALGIDEAKFSNPDNDPRGDWVADPLDAPNIRENLTYPITNPNTGVQHLPPSGRHWRFSPEKFANALNEKRIIFGKSGKSRPQYKRFKSEALSKGTNPFTVWTEMGTATEATQELMKLFDGQKYFDTPKPIRFINEILKLSCDGQNDEIALDFFSGSATTAHAVMQLNAEDGGNRRFILVQLPEVCAADSEAAKAGYATIAEIGKERIRRAGAKIATQAAAKLDAKPLDTGFRVLKVDTSNMADVYYTPDATTQGQLATLASNIKPDRSAEDLLFQVMLDWGVDLAAPMHGTTLAGKTVWAVTEPSGASLLACFDDAGGINDALVRALAEQRPDKVVFRDAGFANDSVKINVEQLFKALSPTTEIRVL